jgi:hypothetical protein
MVVIELVYFYYLNAFPVFTIDTNYVFYREIFLTMVAI